MNNPSRFILCVLAALTVSGYGYGQTKKDVRLELLKMGLHLEAAEIASCQSALETGWYTSYLCVKKHNIFGLVGIGGKFMEFDSWKRCCRAYADLIYSRYDGGDYYEFLIRIGYAEDPDYIRKVKQICN